MKWIFNTSFLANLLPSGTRSSGTKPASTTFATFEEPIRAELFSAERLEQHAETLATAQGIIDNSRKGQKLSPRVTENGRVLLEAYHAIADTVREQRAITPAAEWLIDNFHLVEEQLRDIHDHLPPGFYQELPKLAGGHLRGYPRVYGLAWAFVAHTDSRFDPDLLIRFLRAYQRVQPLTIGELWAVAITLRTVLVENLRRLCVRIVGSQMARHQADSLADELLGLDGQSAQAAEASLRAMGPEPLHEAFAVQMVQRLRYQDPSVTPALQWLNERLAQQVTSADLIVSLEHGKQAAANVTVRNIITSMRLVSAFDWQNFFEQVSLVDATLHTDRGFAAMDFVTRDRYRHAIEELAKRSNHSELEIAQAVLARKADMTQPASVDSAGNTGSPPNPVSEARFSDIGYYLIAGGRHAFEKQLGFRTPPSRRLLRSYLAHASVTYIGSILIGSLLLLALPLTLSAQAGVASAALLLLGLLALFPASEIAVALINRLVNLSFDPRHLPRLEFRAGVPASLRTWVVIPTLLISEQQIEEQIETLEVHYLANPEDNVSFALLSDWTDAATETRPQDFALLDSASARIAALNARHGLAFGAQRFFILHRKRLWNESEQKWIAWERKRGKLHELNRLLRGLPDTSFLPIDGKLPQIPGDVRYIITLDSDTKLPKGAVSELVGTLAHPLNHPRIDPTLKRVVEGYGILQPRVTPALPARRDNSIFQRMFSGPCGIDPYASAVSDVYQDLFAEGSFTGKGIYDIDAFEAVLAGRVPENSMLSHDLFEGTFARCGLVSDIEFIEDFPSHSEVAAARMHRWVRGDWQLLPWIFGRNGITTIGRWKMLDNLRRSLVAPAILLTLLVSWLLPQAPHIVWIVFTLAAFAVPALLPFVTGLLPRRIDITARSHLSGLGDDLLQGCSNVAVMTTLLAHNAWLMVDAIGRTLVRLFVTRRKLLEWVTAAQSKSASSLALTSFLLRLRGSAIVALAVAALVALINPAALPIAAPFIVLWLLAPLLAWYISQPPSARAAQPLTAAEQTLLRLTGRQIWRFFTTFVTAEDHFLPPDNFQETPQPVIAHRSSPTNFGLYLLSVLAARDFGWIGLSETVDRIEATLNSMHALPRLRGHFYNWYETREARALDPKYVSSVDSGNLAGHLLTLAQGCLELTQRPLLASAPAAGVHDSLSLLREAVLQLDDTRRTVTVSSSLLHETIADLELALAKIPASYGELATFWVMAQTRAETLVDVARTFAGERDEDSNEVLAWTLLVQADIDSHARDLESLLPWAGVMATMVGDARWMAIANLGFDMTLAGMASQCRLAIQQLTDPLLTDHSGTPAYDAQFTATLTRAAEACTALDMRLTALSQLARELFNQMDFTFLFDPTRKLFSIGYNVDSHALDASYYDLLASEARLTSFIAIAKGDVPATHWFRLGRSLTPVGNSAALVSWSGSMFEYLMPSLVMYTPRGSLLEQTCRLVIQQQIDYADERNVPWGISESAYNTRDLAFTYQYSNFGIPGLGLKRGLSQDLVIAPYATLLAAIYDPKAAAQNLVRLETVGARGRYGFFEALDFTRSRLPENQQTAIIRAYMAHHQGMSLLALANVLFNGIMRRRFHAETVVQAAELLLQERTPRDVAVARPRADQVQMANVKDAIPLVLQRFNSPHLPVPTSHLLSNGRYAVMLTAAGAGYSRWRDIAVTRWRSDVTCDAWGSFLFLRDAANGQVWSASYQPTRVQADHYEAVFSEDRVRIRRQDDSITSQLEVILSSEDDAELRLLSLTNTGTRTRDIEVTSYAEIVLATPAADIAHPAFSNLFIQTEYLPEVAGLLATRRPRSSTDAPLFAAHVVALSAKSVGKIEYETDRARFLGRGQSIDSPVAVMDGRPLSNTVGPVLDPIMSLRVRVRIAPGATVSMAFATMAAATREEIITLADKYHDSAIFERTSTLAWTQAQVQLHYLGIEPDEAYMFQRLANRILYSDSSLRPSSEALQRNSLNVSGLWTHRISGDLPIILVRIDDADDLGIIQQLLRAHEYWRMKRLAVDLVILNEKTSSYVQDLQISLESLMRTGQATFGHYSHEAHGGIYALRADLLTRQERELLQTVARAVVICRQGSLSEQVMRMRRSQPRPVSVVRRAARSFHDNKLLMPPALEFANGLGGFAEDGREYVTVLGKGQRTPAPWINVIANEKFGFQVSESGAGYTWSQNSREFQLTPWSNDPVSDTPGEVIYLCDEDSGHLWTPTALPIRIESTNYIARHGQGFSSFEHLSHGIHSELLQLVSWNDAIKISRLTLHNRSAQARRISVTGYVEWVLGFSRTTTGATIVTEIDSPTGAMFAHNPLNIEFGKSIAFIDMAGRHTAWSADRTEFLGRNGSLAEPALLLRGGMLSGLVGAGLDACGVLQTQLEFAPGEQIEVVFLLGHAPDREAARELVLRYRTTPVKSVLARVTEQWEQILGKVQVQTPDRSLDIMLNRWLQYQTLACRFWARAAFYQAGGAYGFRDQLQDVMALVVTGPALARAHILRAAARQFVEGDVQHWWHPPTGRGVRTHFSDDLVWLPYVVAHYLSVTQDLAVLDESIPFIEGHILEPGQEDSYFEPLRSEQQVALFEHCARTLERSLAVGVHGLPLMGSGDWNDGMNRVGHEGRGESVWLAWFLHRTLTLFVPLATQRGKRAYAKRWREHADKLKTALEQQAWDGAWYRRAYFDDGTPLGSAANAECQIDSIAQSWAVLSGAGDHVRAWQAMASVDEHLIRRRDELVLLFTPPFDKTPQDPGYIKGYLPGVRENGGQYTHAAIWTVMAFAALGDGTKAAQLFAMLNPINHASTRAKVHCYKVEPYVIAADIYAVPPHVGRGGWTWYTGSAGWMYRAGMESILGLAVRGASLSLDPCIPEHWPGFTIHFRHGASRFEISVDNPQRVTRGIASMELDGHPLAALSVPLVDDGQVHRVRVILGTPAGLP